MTEWITTTEAAHISSYHPDYVRKLLQAGKVNGRKFGTTWQVDRQSLLTYLEQVNAQGDRRGPKPQ